MRSISDFKSLILKERSDDSKCSSPASKCVLKQLQKYYVGPARSVSELIEAFSLVYQEYLKLGYCIPQKPYLRYSALQLLPSSKTIVSHDQGSVKATISLVIDSPAGLPMGDQFCQELDALRAEGRLLAEATMFAVAEEKKELLGKKDSVLELLAGLLSHAEKSNVDTIVCVINPKHAGFWKNVLKFKHLSSFDRCAHVEGAPGMLFMCDLRALRPGMQPYKFDFLVQEFSKRTVESQIDKTVLTVEDVLYLMNLNTQVLENIAPTVVDELVKYYGEAVLEGILDESQERLIA